MQVQRVLLFFLFSQSIPSFAASKLELSPIQKVYWTASQLYSIGEDNNWIAFDQLTRSQLEDLQTKPGQLAKAYSYNLIGERKEELKNTIQTCIFMQKGAYGEHLSKELQDLITERYAQTLTQLAEQNRMWVFEMEGEFLATEAEMLSAPCALVVFYQDMYFLMQATAQD